jgi:hypothetical protein
MERRHLHLASLLVLCFVICERVDAVDQNQEVQTRVVQRYVTEVQTRVETRIATQNAKGVTNAGPSNATPKAPVVAPAPAGTTNDEFTANRTVTTDNGIQYPAGCQDDTCKYVAYWDVSYTNVTVTVQSAQDKSEAIMIAFCRNKHTPCDVIYGYTNANDPAACSSQADEVPDKCGTVVDAHLDTAGGAPVRDTIQNIISSSVRYYGGICTMIVTMSLVRDATEDQPLGQPGGAYVAIYPDGVAVKNGVASAPTKTGYSSVPFCFCNDVRTTYQEFTSVIVTQSRQFKGYRYPKGCTPPSCVYTADMQVDDAKDTITFKLKARITKDRWFGIGWTAKKELKSIDLIACYYEKSVTPKCVDAYWKDGPGSKIAIDAQQDLTGCALDYDTAAGDMSCTVTRKRDTGADQSDLSLEAQYNRFFVYIIGGGSCTGNEINQPENTPEIATDAACGCSDKEANASPAPPSQSTSRGNEVKSTSTPSQLSPGQTTKQSPGGPSTQPPPGQTTTQPSSGQSQSPVGPKTSEVVPATTTTASVKYGSKFPGFCYPPECNFRDDCQYIANITVIESDTSMILIYVRAKQERKRWIGMGGSYQKTYTNIDFWGGYFPDDSNKETTVDGFYTGVGASEIILDQKQDLGLLSLEYRNGYMEFRCIRKRSTGDTAQDIMLVKGRVYYLYFFIFGGDCEGGRVFPPKEQPRMTENRTCVCTDDEADTTPSPDSTTTGPKASLTTPASQPSLTTLATQPSPTTTTPAPQSSPTTTTPAPQSSPTTTTPAPQPSQTTTTPAPQPSPTTTTPAPQPSPTTTTPAPQPSPTTTTPAPQPSPTTTTPAPQPSPTTTTSAHQPSQTARAPQPQ